MADTFTAERTDAPSAAQLGALIELASDGIFVADADGRYTFVNEAGCRMLGFSRDQILGRTIFDLIPEEDVERLLDSKAQMLSGRTHIAEWRLRRKDGVLLPVEVSAKILPDGQWQGFVRDISERKAQQAQREGLLREIETEHHWLHTVLDTLPIGVVLYRLGGSAFYNRRCEELIGMKLSATGGSAQYANRFFYSDGRPVPPSELLSARVLRDQQTIVGSEFVIERPDGSRISLLGSAAPVRDAGGRMLGGVSVFQDVSERMRQEEILRSERRLLKIVFDLLPVGLWIADREGRITHSNRAGDRIWQGARYVGPQQVGEYKGWWVDTGKPISPEEWGLSRAVRLGETSRGELIRIQCFDGSFKTVINWAAPIHSDAGELTGAIAVNEDVTSLVHTQEQLRTAVRDREDILAIVAHDLRNPLASIMLMAEGIRLKSDALAEESLRDMTTSMVDTTRRMAGLVDDLLGVAVAQGGGSMLKLAPTTVSALLTRMAAAARPVLALRRLSLEIKIADDLSMLHIDDNRILRVFANLLDNALKFTSPGGRILVAAEAVTAGASFAVANSGEALPSDILHAMFQPFWQAAQGDRRGAGLGLAICRSIVEAHGGTIWAEPAQGERVRICFVLPRSPAATT